MSSLESQGCGLRFVSWLGAPQGGSGVKRQVRHGCVPDIARDHLESRIIGAQERNGILHELIGD